MQQPDKNICSAQLETEPWEPFYIVNQKDGPFIFVDKIQDKQQNTAGCNIKATPSVTKM
jgi:hypothetical protein